MTRKPTHDHDSRRADGEATAAGDTPPSRSGAMTRHKMMTRATIGLGGAMGAIIAVPAAVAVLAPDFKRATTYPVDIGPAMLYPEVPEGEVPWHTVTFERAPNDASGLARRLAYVRNNGDGTFTAISNTCMHVGCPVQSNATGFACPCHGGQYDSEGRRTAGPPVRPLNRYETSVDERGHLILGQLYALDDDLNRHPIMAPGEPVAGLLSDAYPEVPLG